MTARNQLLESTLVLTMLATLLLAAYTGDTATPTATLRFSPTDHRDHHSEFRPSEPHHHPDLY